MTTLSFSIDPKSSILILLDYQNVIINSIPNTLILLEKMSTAVEEARSKGMPIGYVRVAFTDDDYKQAFNLNKKFYDIAINLDIHDESVNTQIHDLVAPKLGDIVVRKTRFGAFATTDLDVQLKVRNINTIILAGFSTSGVVLSTVREAFDLDYRIVVLEDAMADVDIKVHELLIKKVFPRQAQVITINEFLQKIDI